MNPLVIKGNKAWLDAKALSNPHRATASTELLVESTPEEFSVLPSAPLSDGRRTWLFPTVQLRDQFVQMYAGYPHHAEKAK